MKYEERASWDKIAEEYREKYPPPNVDNTQLYVFRNGWEACEFYLINKEKEKKDFLIVEIGNGYTIKYDGYREKLHWTLLKTGGGRVLDGTFEDVIKAIISKKDAIDMSGGISEDIYDKLTELDPVKFPKKES